ncbi:acyl-CoA dehydrogenase family protein [Actinokineospora cianjurensis]|uniref:Acyl-CoA dehydrogenase-like protein n=1 Tax=Actinokineospora cianjurensis TaxID=585224 RepID=A0A421B2G9_9PSEU|nr:acyl-CoA dehydrogenase family protein [Actinokineospora cianjurensis]RLK58545.1 acyl-CoA dehydrogenase-like protein [Actinokineospora cianjurensis]
MSGAAIESWLEPLRAVLDPADEVCWPRLRDFADCLDSALGRYPVGADLPAGPPRSGRLLEVRAVLAAAGFADNSPAFQLLAQFVAGYRDIDLRDATGLGHGDLIRRHGTERTRRRWLPRLRAGALAGIAITEPHGGSQVARTSTRAMADQAGTWLLTGRKTWISRLTEAELFVVFFRAPHGRLAAAVVDAADPGLHRRTLSPAGLAGWTWGVLDLDQVPVHPHDVLSQDGMAMLRGHFAVYRSLVTATALGAAAAVFDTVTTNLADRRADGRIARIRDSSLVSLGRGHARLVTALLGTATASRLAVAGDERAELWGCAMKAHGVDTAHRVVAELAVLLGAAGFQVSCQAVKTSRDLSGLLYADGIHDTLYRTAGKQHIRPATRESEGALAAGA